MLRVHFRPYSKSRPESSLTSLLCRDKWQFDIFLWREEIEVFLKDKAVRAEDPKNKQRTYTQRKIAPLLSRFHGVMVSTQDSESCDPSSNLGGT